MGTDGPLVAGGANRLTIHCRKHFYCCARTLCRSSERIFFLFFSSFSDAGMQQVRPARRGCALPWQRCSQAHAATSHRILAAWPRDASTLIDTTRFRRKKGRPCRKDWYQCPETSLAFASAARAHSRSIFAMARKRKQERASNTQSTGRTHDQAALSETPSYLRADFRDGFSGRIFGTDFRDGFWGRILGTDFGDGFSGRIFGTDFRSSSGVGSRREDFRNQF